MRHQTRFVLSHNLYAVDLDSLTTEQWDSTTYCLVSAVWFRRRRGVTVACVGSLSRFMAPVPDTAREFVERYDDGRYGGSCEGRWDGTNYWGAQEPDVITEHLALLRPMLADYPNAPEGYDAWWRF